MRLNLELLVAQRQEARENKNYKLSDEIRDILLENNIIIFI